MCMQLNNALHILLSALANGMASVLLCPNAHDTKPCCAFLASSMQTPPRAFLRPWTQLSRWRCAPSQWTC